MEKFDGVTTFQAQMDRIHFVTQTRTQVELADFLGIRQSSVSDAKRRERIPSDWLVTLMRTKNVYPEWILTGNGPCHVCETTSPGQYESGDKAEERRADEDALRRLSARTLAEELVRRIAVSQADKFTRHESGPNDLCKMKDVAAAQKI